MSWLKEKQNCCTRDSPGLRDDAANRRNFARIVVGVIFLMHVSTKFKLGADALAADVFSKNGIEPALLWTYVVMTLESVGAAA